MDDDKKKLLASLATSDLFETLQQATKAVRAISALNNKIMQPSRDLQETLFGASRRMQQRFEAPTSAISKLVSINPLRDTFESISRMMAIWKEELLPMMDEIDRQNQAASEELPKISAKLHTVPDEGHTIRDVELSILRLEKIDEICVQIIAELENGIRFYNNLEDNIDCREELGVLDVNLKEVQLRQSRCRELLAAKRIQLDFLADTDAEYESRPKPKTAEEECDIFFPDYVAEFLEMERTLTRYKYLDTGRRWIKDKQVLASFVQKLMDCKYLKPGDASVIVRRRTIREFFERRYNVDITEQFKPSKAKEYPLPLLFPVDLTNKR